MMGKTHIAMGVATATAITYLPTFSDAPLTAAVIGGAVGGIVCDVDTESNSHCRDALYARIIAGVIVLVSLGLDYVLGLGVCESILNGNYHIRLLGVGLFIVTCVAGYFTSHRTFTHSLLAMLIWAVMLGMFCFPIVPFFVAGFLSHIILDILNKKDVQVFYPIGNGFCIGMCYADGIMNLVFLIGGIIISLGLIGADVAGIDITTIM